jgi:hypothetical protein
MLTLQTISDLDSCGSEPQWYQSMSGKPIQLESPVSRPPSLICILTTTFGKVNVALRERIVPLFNGRWNQLSGRKSTSVYYFKHGGSLWIPTRMLERIASPVYCSERCINCCCSRKLICYQKHSIMLKRQMILAPTSMQWCGSCDEIITESQDCQARVKLLETLNLVQTELTTSSIVPRSTLRPETRVKINLMRGTGHWLGNHRAMLSFRHWSDPSHKICRSSNTFESKAKRRRAIGNWKLSLTSSLADSMDSFGLRCLRV